MPRKTTGAAFWQLMDEWKIPDDLALALIDHPPSQSGRRPRFALATEQADRLDLLREIGRVAANVHGDAGAWLRKPNRAAPFKLRSPAELMAREGLNGMRRVLQVLERAALSASLSRNRKPVQPA